MEHKPCRLLGTKVACQPNANANSEDASTHPNRREERPREYWHSTEKPGVLAFYACVTTVETLCPEVEHITWYDETLRNIGRRERIERTQTLDHVLFGATHVQGGAGDVKEGARIFTTTVDAETRGGTIGVGSASVRDGSCSERRWNKSGMDRFRSSNGRTIFGWKNRFKSNYGRTIL